MNGHPVSVEWNGRILYHWPGSDLLLPKGMKPLWCRGCGCELLQGGKATTQCPDCRHLDSLRVAYRDTHDPRIGRRIAEAEQQRDAYKAEMRGKA